MLPSIFFFSFQGGVQSYRHRHVRPGLVEGQMFRSRRLLPVQLRDQSAARRETVTSHTQHTGVGRRH